MAAPNVIKKMQMWSVNKPTPNPRNSRRHSKEQIASLRRAIREFGLNKPIVVDEENVILAGHGALEAAKAEGLKMVPVVVREGLTEEQKRAYMIADNRIALGSEWDFDVLQDEVRALAGAEFDLESLGFAEKELEGILEQGYSNSGEEDPNAHWKGMPEFTQDDKTAHQSIHVHFHTQEDVEKFAELVGQPITSKTRSMWYPEWEIEKALDKRYGQDEKK